MVIVNEYHHVAAFSFEKARKVAKVKYPAVGTLTVTWVFTPEDGQYAVVALAFRRKRAHEQTRKKGRPLDGPFAAGEQKGNHPVGGFLFEGR